MKSKILFQNKYFVIVDKAPMILTVPSREGIADKRQCLGYELQNALGRQVYPVHRLDYEVQGIVLFALDSESHRQSNKWFESQMISKTYSALTTFGGGPMSVEFHISLEWKCKILRGKKRAYESAHGKDSLTQAVLTKKDESGFYHWELQPITGRSHQLRFELARHNFPIIGDALYGSTEKFSQEGIALRAFRIDFSKTDFEKFDLPKIFETNKF